MKRICFILVSLLLIANVAIAQKPPRIKFNKTEHDFGVFNESVGKVSYDFVFKNLGGQPLVILRTSASCGCTQPTYPREPIMPGDSAVISVTYNAEGRPGAFMKLINVTANTQPEKTVLYIKGNVIPKDQGGK